MKRTTFWFALLFGMAVFGVSSGLLAADAASVKPRRLNLRAAPTTRSAVVTVLERGAELEVVQSAGAWVKVRVPATGDVGFVYRSLVEITEVEEASPPEPAPPEPMREPAPEPVRAPAPRPAPVRAPAPRREPAPPAAAPVSEHAARIVIFANGMNTQGISGSMPVAFTQYHEAASVSEGYDFDSGFGFEVGAAARLIGPLGLHVAYAAAAARGGAAAVSAQIPHPFYYRQPRSLSTSIAGLDQTESAIHVDLAVLPGKTGRLRFVAFAGVSLFSAKLDLLQLPELSETYPYDQVVASFPTETLEDGPLGFNAGASIDFYFSRNLGFGAQVRYSQGKARFDQGEKGALDVDLGGAQVGFGLRAAF